MMHARPIGGQGLECSQHVTIVAVADFKIVPLRGGRCWAGLRQGREGGLETVRRIILRPLRQDNPTCVSEGGAQADGIPCKKQPGQFACPTAPTQ